MTTQTRSDELFAEAQRVIPGGVNSPVRAFRAVGGHPLFIERGEGAVSLDVDGQRYIDYVLSWGPLILGHAHPAVVRGDHGAGGARHEFRRADRSWRRNWRSWSSRRCPPSRWCASSTPAPRRR